MAKNKKPKEEYDWSSDDIRCTKCRTKTDTGHGIQFLDDAGKCQRYCVRCYCESLNG